ncbi:hypothetical protein J6590_097311 [Homalodisca vitripennis]|nr:hypothetical protein J6590_097311 [Homalodisca vitripennis]
MIPVPRSSYTHRVFGCWRSALNRGADTPECPSRYAPGYPARYAPGCAARYAPGSISERNSWPFVQYPGGTGILLVSPSACVLPVVRDDD